MKRLRIALLLVCVLTALCFGACNATNRAGTLTHKAQ